MIINQKLSEVQAEGEEIGFATVKLFKLVFGGIGVFVLGFILGLFRRQ